MVAVIKGVRKKQTEGLATITERITPKNNTRNTNMNTITMY
jgi:hypothetical protein